MLKRTKEDKFAALKREIDQAHSLIERNVESIEPYVASFREQAEKGWHEAIGELKKEWSPKEQISRHPWASLGSSALFGIVAQQFVAGKIFNKGVRQGLLAAPMVRSLLNDLNLAIIGWTVNKTINFLKPTAESQTTEVVSGRGFVSPSAMNGSAARVKSDHKRDFFTM